MFGRREASASLRRPIWAAACAAGVVAALGAFAATASAGTYVVVSCKDRAGTPAPISDAAGGWQASYTTNALGLTWTNRCSDPTRGFEASIDGSRARATGSRVWWQFLAPAATRIIGADVLYLGYARPYDGRNQGVIAVAAPSVGNLAAHFGAGTVSGRWAAARNLNDPWIYVMAECSGASWDPDCPAGIEHATIEVLRSEIALSDETPPSAGPVTGSAVASATWTGTQVFAFGATDDGGGVYQAFLDVDGSNVLTRTIDTFGGRCVDTTAGQRVFRYPRPCPSSTDAVVAVDANSLPVGDHDVTLRISDAAGNLRTVYSARKAVVAPAKPVGPGSTPAERGPANGENPADDARLTVRWDTTKRQTLTSPYGRRNVIRGRLTTAAGAGIRNARIELLTSVDGSTGAPIDKGGARTRRDGRFTLILPANVSSRTLLLRYRSHANDTVSVAEGTLRLKVRAGVQLSVAPHTAARGRTVRLSGRLIGGPLPETGKVVELQARSPGEKWITFRTIRASRRGTFATRYRFRQGGPALYLMRARVRETGDYPYATGVSRATRVRVR
jgi:hypothetical protein